MENSKEPARPSKPNYGSGYDQKRGDQHGKRDGHGGYVPNDKSTRDMHKQKEGYNQAYGDDRD